MFPKKRLGALHNELQQQHAMGRNQSRKQQQRIQELQQRAIENPQSMSRNELAFLDDIDQMALQDAQARQAFKEAAELRGYQKEIANGQAPSNQESFNSLIGKENAKRNQAAREKLARNITIGGTVAGVGGVALGTAGVAAAATGNFPFSLAAMGGDDAALAAQQFRIEKELEEREFQNGLAQRTALAQTNLDNKLHATQQQAIFEQNLANSLQQQQAGAMGQGGAGVNVLDKINSLAAEYMSQGIEAPKAFDLAQNAVRMDGTANNYL